MGNIPPPSPQTKQLFEGEEFINLCKALNLCVNSIAQMSKLQIELATTPAERENMNNSGRIILFTSERYRNLDQLQEFVAKAIEECNKTIEQTMKNENM
jgi:hypothetical protein